MILGICCTLNFHECREKCSDPAKDKQIARLIKENFEMKEQLKMGEGSCEDFNSNKESYTANDSKLVDGKINLTVVVLDKKYETINRKIEELVIEFKKNKDEHHKQSATIKKLIDRQPIQAINCENSCTSCKKSNVALHKEKSNLKREIASIMKKYKHCTNTETHKPIGPEVWNGEIKKTRKQPEKFSTHPTKEESYESSESYESASNYD